MDARAVERDEGWSAYLRLSASRRARFHSSWRRIELFGTNNARLQNSNSVRTPAYKIACKKRGEGTVINGTESLSQGD